MKIDILTLFPEMFDGPFGSSIIKRAREKGLVHINTINIRDFAYDKHRVVDDYPFGGGAGMVMKPEPIYGAVSSAKETNTGKVILLCPQGKVFSQSIAVNLAQEKEMILICGHYEGIDERVREGLIDEEISIGDYVLTGGELPAMILVDAVSRLIPGVLGEEESFQTDSFYDGLLEYPQYTRPREFNGMVVPDILLSGDHEKIRKWRRMQSIMRTADRRPDIFEKIELSAEDKELYRIGCTQQGGTGIESGE
jgi:tRNA (guanine37-N1)-methyltransferase